MKEKTEWEGTGSAKDYWQGTEGHARYWVDADLRWVNFGDKIVEAHKLDYRGKILGDQDETKD